jgi:SAM-dependent methyltransferase
MRIGLREEHLFRYCDSCRFLELENIPANLGFYYSDYYTAQKKYYKLNTLRQIIWTLRASLYEGLFHPLLHRFAFNTVLDWKYRLKIKSNARIIDVGCGNGDILFEFYKNGFRNLEGIDPFPPDDGLNRPFQIRKGTLENIQSDERFDLIMMHHSFEHMPGQMQVLEKAASLLSQNGKLLIRMPVVNKAFEIYRENWVQIDAPRHLGIHSTNSFNIIADRAGLVISDVFFDSTAFQFLGSEQNKADIDFFAPNSYKTNRGASIFKESDFLQFEEKAQQYNREGLGDQAAFILKRK